MGIPLSKDQLTWLMSRFDMDHDGGIDYQVGNLWRHFVWLPLGLFPWGQAS